MPACNASARESRPGYDAAGIDRWAEVARAWAGGDAPDGLDYIAPPQADGTRRDVFMFMINGAKVRAPAAARALIARLE